MSNPNETPSLNQEGSHFTNQFKETESFFSSASNNLGKLLGDPLMREDCMALFMAVTPDNGKSDEKVMQMKSYLNSYISIVADYVNRYAEVKGFQFITDMENWLKVINNLPLMKSSGIEKNNYKRNLSGTEIASDLISLFYKSGTRASDAFKNYLSHHARWIKNGIGSSGSFKIIVVVMSVELSESEEKHTAKIKIYKADLNSGNAPWIDGCNSSSAFDIDINYSHVTSEFNFDALNDKSTKKQLDRFIDQTRKIDITDIPNYYEGTYGS